MADSIDELLEATADGQLTLAYAALGRQDPETAGFGPESLAELVHVGKQWWATNEPRVREIVCRNTFVRRVADDDEKDVVVAIAGALGTLYGADKSVIAGVLILRLGLRQWCRAEWLPPPIPAEG